jgi:cytochrome bd-type quinol oxidase subunit 2
VDPVLLSRITFAFLIAFQFMYTGWSYRVFRGKVRAGAGYH